jgi:hypothetical protein
MRQLLDHYERRVILLSVPHGSPRRLFIDILLRLKAEESHGTAPLDWDIRV